jgi:hypothetical protein
MFAAGFVPLLHLDDHPEDDRYALRLKISLPATLEAFAQAQWPASQRLELCLDTDRIVAHTGPEALAEPCRPAPVTGKRGSIELGVARGRALGLAMEAVKPACRRFRWPCA